MRLPNTGISDASAATEEQVRLMSETYFRGKLPKGKLFQVAATDRGDYVEVMVFVANIKDDADLDRKANTWANALQEQLEEDGVPAIIYVHTYTPPVRRIRD